MPLRHLTCWAVTDGSAGMVSQVRGVAQAVGILTEFKSCRRKPPFVWLPNGMAGNALHQLTDDSDALTPPWPDLVLTCGRRSAPLGAAVRKASGGKSFAVHLQDPQMDPRAFDLVIAMRHDKVKGENVVKTQLAVHHITPQLLEQAAQDFAERFAAYPRPLIAVLIGGSTNKYILSEKAVGKLIADLRSLLNQTQGTLLVTPSRRTGEENTARLREGLDDHARVYFADLTQVNPYLGFLALADYLVVTNDSVSMMSEACTTGKPLYILPLLGHDDTKPSRFADMLTAQGMARPLKGPLEKWHYEVPDETAQVAARIREKLVGR